MLAGPTSKQFNENGFRADKRGCHEELMYAKFIETKLIKICLYKWRLYLKWEIPISARAQKNKCFLLLSYITHGKFEENSMNRI